MYDALERLLSAIGIKPSEAGGTIALSGVDPVVPGRHRTGLAAASALAAQGATIAAIWRLRLGEEQDIAVDLCYHFRMGTINFAEKR